MATDAREAAILEFMNKVGYPRAVAEEAVDEIDDYIQDWTAQMRDYNRRHYAPSEEDMPRWLTEQQKFHERLKIEREQERLDRIALGPLYRKKGRK